MNAKRTVPILAWVNVSFCVMLVGQVLIEAAFDLNPGGSIILPVFTTLLIGSFVTWLTLLVGVGVTLLSKRPVPLPLFVYVWLILCGLVGGSFCLWFMKLMCLI